MCGVSKSIRLIAAVLTGSYNGKPVRKYIIIVCSVVCIVKFVGIRTRDQIILCEDLKRQ